MWEITCSFFCTRSYVDDCRSLQSSNRAGTWRPPTFRGHENISQYVVKLADVTTIETVSLLYNQSIFGAGGDEVGAAAGNNACCCTVAISGKSGALGSAYGPIKIDMYLRFGGHCHGRTTAARSGDASFASRLGGGHNLPRCPCFHSLSTQLLVQKKEVVITRLERALSQPAFPVLVKVTICFGQC